MENVIFVIEDDINISSAFMAKFAMFGTKVVVSDGSGEITAIINKIKNSKPEYIILDIILPQNDGFVILQKIKADNDVNHIPVFIYSDFSDADLKKRCENLGAEYYLIKEEFNIDNLINKINRIIYNRDNVTNYFN